MSTPSNDDADTADVDRPEDYGSLTVEDDPEGTTDPGVPISSGIVAQSFRPYGITPYNEDEEEP